MGFPLRWSELSSAAIHWKNSATIIPRINRTDGVNTGRQTYRQGCLARTVENRANEESGETGFLLEVQVVGDFGGVRTTGPRLLLRIRHGSVVHERGDISTENGIESVEKGPYIWRIALGDRWERWGLGSYKTRVKSIERQHYRRPI